MTCWDCKHDDHDYGFCTLCSCKPPTTGNPKTCPYFERR